MRNTECKVCPNREKHEGHAQCRSTEPHISHTWISDTHDYGSYICLGVPKRFAVESIMSDDQITNAVREAAEAIEDYSALLDSQQKWIGRLIDEQDRRRFAS